MHFFTLWGLFFAEMLAIIKDLWYTIYNICNFELQGFEVLDKVQYYMEGKGFLWLKMKIMLSLKNKLN